MPLSHIDVFSGIAGFTHALHGVSTTRLYCDISPTSQQALQTLMRKGKIPTAPIVSDVKNLSKAITFKPDIMTAGFPCTGMSTAGKLEKFDNADTALFFHLVTLARQHRPPLIMLENVRQVLDPAILKTVTTPFIKMGYRVRWTLVPAYAVGLPHKRMRWFCACFLSLPLLKRVAVGMKQQRRKEPPRCVPVRDPAFLKRTALLGYTVVPACIVAAFKHMAACTHDGWCEYPIPVPPDLGLVIKQGSLVIRKPLWPTARAAPGTAVVLTDRCAKDLPTAVKFEVKSSSPFMNVDWCEWLMGFGKNWTALS